MEWQPPERVVRSSMQTESRKLSGMVGSGVLALTAQDRVPVSRLHVIWLGGVYRLGKHNRSTA